MSSTGRLRNRQVHRKDGVDHSTCGVEQIMYIRLKDIQGLIQTRTVIL